MHDKAMCLMFGVPENAVQEKALHYEIPSKPWEVIGTDVFMINDNSPLHFRLPQQIPNSEASKQPFSR